MPTTKENEHTKICTGDELNRLVLRLAEIGLQTYGRRGADLVKTSSYQKLQMQEAFLRDWITSFYALTKLSKFGDNKEITLIRK